MRMPRPARNLRSALCALPSASRREHNRDLLRRVEAVDRAKLSDEGKLACDLFLLQARTNVEATACRRGVHLNQMGGIYQLLGRSKSCARTRSASSAGSSTSRALHDAVLAAGPLPTALLEARMKDRVAKQKGGRKATIPVTVP